MLRCLVATLLCALLVVSPLPTAAQDDMPPHPRLLFGRNDLQTLREQGQGTHQEIWTAIKTFADTLVGTAPPAQPAADMTEEDFRAAGDLLIPLGFSCLITEDDAYCGAARDYLLAYAGWQQWDVPDRRDLGTAHMLFGASLAYDWVYNMLDENDRSTIAAAIAGHTQEMYQASAGPYSDAYTNWWAGSYVQNHFSTNNSALGMAGLALAGDVDADTTAWIEQATSELTIITDLLEQINDGSWHEGTYYQSYMLTMMLPFLTNLRALRQIDLLPDSYLRHVADWQIYNYLPGRHEFILAYGDFEPWWGNAFDRQNLLRFAAAEYDSPAAEWMAQQVVATTGRGTGGASVPWQVMEYFYYDPTVATGSPGELNSAQLFPDLGAVIWRTGWEPDSLVFALKGGSYGGRFAMETFAHQLYPWGESCADVGCTFNVSHDHADANTFYLYNQNQWLANEWAGYGVADTTSHNTVVIDGQNQFLPTTSDYAHPEAFSGTEGYISAHVEGRGFNYVASNATGRYTPVIGDLHDFTRHVVFIRPGYLLMLDNLDADDPHTYYWIAHFAESVAIEDNWIRGNAAENQVLAVGIASPQPFDAITSEDALPYARVAPAEQVADTRFIHLLYPTNTAGWDSRPSVTLGEDNGKAALTRVELADGSADEIIIRYAANRSTNHVGDYATDAQVVVVRRDAAGETDGIYSYGGTFLANAATGQMLLNNLTPEQAFEATFEAGAVDLHSEAPAGVTLYAPGVSALTRDGEPLAFEQRGDHLIVTE